MDTIVTGSKSGDGTVFSLDIHDVSVLSTSAELISSMAVSTKTVWFFVLTFAFAISLGNRIYFSLD